eukprot:TRINITY_DN35645_c0_g1_i1.p1 TRINITY_DN35645_c0_g1~~TRINITY_DN35645_c0_g1_i1.p1  ORF type:complete len:282 (-),score=69.69 TRINITY_DN35645_c0_g1_i1:105-950(-)
MEAAAGGPDPREFGMSSLPEQHEDQLALGFRMIQNAYNSKVQTLEQELRGLRLSFDEQKTQAQTFQRKASQLEVELVEGHQKAQQLAEENKELFKTVQSLRRQLQRLEGLKKRVLESISDEQNAENGEDSRLYMRDDYLLGALPATISSMQGEFSALPAIGTSFAGARSVSPQASAQAPTAPVSDSYRPPQMETPYHPASAVPTEPLAAPGGAPLDGKQFFRQARNSLSYEAFNEFLANIKRLNNQQQSREETLAEARKIFGPEQQHLYKEFEQLLSRHGA